jgi:membrane peptidoglycan carboxypeptidase
MAKRFSGNNRGRKSSNRITTGSGKELKVNRSLGEKWTAKREAKAYRKVQRLRGLPKSRVKRLAWHLNPKRAAAYWFSRDGGIMALKIAGIGILALFVLTLGVFAYFRKDLPNVKDISGSSLGGSISYYDRTGQNLLFQDYNAVKRVPVQSKDISPYLKDATVATEDRDFYKHRGFDVKGISRAAYNDVARQGGTQGGSTITQQLVKLTQDWTQQRSITRKLKEVILAVELERTYTKDEILTGYLNAAPYGGVDYGAQAASSDYFHVQAKDLTLAQAAMLAAIPKAPSYYSKYSPDFDEKSFVGRYYYVLDSMVQTGKITKDKAEEAKKVDVLAQVQPQQEKYAGIRAPFFMLSARNELNNKFMPSSKNGGTNKVGGWKVITTIDLNLQGIADKVVQDNRRNALAHGADEQALVAEDVKTGQMMAVVGGVDFNDPDHGKINYAQWNIAPGSSFKPYDYASLIDNSNNVGAGSVLYDVQQPLPGYPCTNKNRPFIGNRATGGNCLWDYDFRYPGPVTLRYALGGSRNVPAVKAMLQVGVDKTIKTATGMMNAPGAYKCYQEGVDVNIATKNDEAQCYGAAAIGDGAYLHLDQHVNGLATMARLGQAIPQTYILKIYDSKSSTKPFYQWKQPKNGDAGVKQVIRQDSAYIVNNMASDPNASYLPSGYYKWHNYNGWKTAIKTGTTNNGFDGLMMGWNTKFAVGSWVGYHTRNKSLTGAMEYSTAPLTRGFMTAALDSLHAQPENWTEPGNIQHQAGYVVRSHVGIGSVEPSPTTELFPSWYKQKSTTSQSQTIDRVSGKLATSCTPASAKQVLGGNAAPNTYSVDSFYPPGQGAASSSVSANTSASDDVHSCSDSPPTISVTATDNNNGTATLAAFVSAGTHKLNDAQYSQYPGTVTFSVNGIVVGTRPVNDPQDNVSMSYDVPQSGSYTVTATVTDSVLYSATDSTSSNLTAGATTTAPAITGANAVGPTMTISWSGGTGPYTIYNGSTNNPVGGTCNSTNGLSCIAPKSSTVYVKDSDGHQSSTATVN